MVKVKDKLDFLNATKQAHNYGIDGEVDIFETTTILEVESVSKGKEQEVVVSSLSADAILEEINTSQLGKKPQGKIVSTETVTSEIFTSDKIKATETETMYEGAVVTARKNGKEIKARYSLDFDRFTPQEVSLSRTMTPYDREVYEAICSLYAAGNRFVSAAMIYRTMHLDDNNGFVHKKTQKEINAIVRKMAFTAIKIDASEEVLAYGGLDKHQHDGYLLPAVKNTITYKGVKADYWQLLSEPVLFTYAQLKGQVYILPKPVVRIRTDKARTKKSTIIQGYLTDRIIRMKKNSNLSKTILLESIYEYVAKCFPDESTTEKKDRVTRQIVTEVLEDWKKVEFVSGFEWKKEGRKINSVVVEITDTKIKKVVIE